MCWLKSWQRSRPGRSICETFCLNLRLTYDASKKAELPVYSFEKHARLDKTTTIYSPHVLVIEGIFALHDQRVLDMLDLKIFTEADADLCLSRRRKSITSRRRVLLANPNGK